MLADAVMCLALNIYWEARNQPIEGKRAVAEVVMNRSYSPKFPDHPCDVIYQAKTWPSGHPKKNQCHFSWFCDGLSDVPTDWGAWAEALIIASHVWNDYEPKIAPCELYYHTIQVDPEWAMRFEPTQIIGDHIFYREKDEKDCTSPSFRRFNFHGQRW